jgi:hypothetical protein
MPGAGTTRAKQKRAGSLGQSARLYTLKTKAGNIKIPGAQGFGKHNAATGSMISLDMTKQIRKTLRNNCGSFTRFAY